MLHQTAIQLLRHEALTATQPQVWADLGCGTGTFTKALASLIPAGSIIHAVDQDGRSLKQIPGQFEEVQIQTRESDFAKAAFTFPPVNGMLMANALHYVKQKEAFLERVNEGLLPGGLFLLVEYNTTKANPWVPYPIDKKQAALLLTSLHFHSIQKMHEIPSRFGGTIYALSAKK
ncbi:MAG: class I SAM-dependent methyltransferase [Saprospiraceae bacterium]|nr:class I SAM-dependent methyltransferase [Saprospiraceae bacterium]